MIILISGTTHTGKTNLAQRLLEKYKFPYLSIDHLKMGLIRSGNTDISVEDDDSLTEYLWPIVREIIKTNIENRQNLIIEGCYIPFDWRVDFEKEYLSEIKYICIVMSEEYIKNNIDVITSYGNVVEKRLDDALDVNSMIEENNYNLEMCKINGLRYILIESDYERNLETALQI
ncbi:MAG: adenylate kinase [Tissierellia bacterium]|nr:adenylate kinase [Tissierellia bacterium]